jgi:hypothetical protein
MKRQNRGMGFTFQPTYRDKRTGEKKTSAVWWISFSTHGKRTKESSESTNRADAVRLLKKRIGDVQAGKAVGNVVERTTLNDLISMVEADYKANARRSADRIPYAAAHLRAYFGGDAKAREIGSDRITSYLAARLEDGAARSTANYEQSLLNRGFRLAGAPDGSRRHPPSAFCAATTSGAVSSSASNSSRCAGIYPSTCGR